MSEPSAFSGRDLVATLVDVCRQRGLFALLDRREFRDRAWLIRELGANAGYFAIALEALEEAGWLEKNSEDAYRLADSAGNAGEETSEVAASYRPVLDALPTAEACLILAASVGLFNDDGVKRHPLSSLAKRDYVIRHAALADLDRLDRLEELCWRHTRTPRTQILSRLQHDPGNQFVLEKDGKVLGVIYSQRIAAADALMTRTAADVHELRDPSGPVVQLLAVNLDPQAQDASYGDQLLEFMLQRCSLMTGIEQVVGVTLCKRFDAAGSASFEEYIRRQGSSQDPVLAFHWAHGAEIVRALPGYRPEDHANRSNGVLVAYDIRNRPQRRRQPTVDRPAADAEHIAQFVREEAARVMGIGESELDPDRPVMEMGLDSADLLKLQRLCEERFGLQLPAGFFFEHSSIRKVIEHVVTLLAATPEVMSAAIAIGESERVPAVHDDRSNTDRVSPTDIAVVGMSCKLPGGIETPDDLWRVLAANECVIGSFPKSRRDWPSASDYPGIDRGGFVDDGDAFDAAFFRISPAEAQVTDPQQRMLLQLAWTCLEDAGVLPAALKGTNTGVFVGASNCDYSRLVQDAGLEIEAYNGVGSSLAILANRISYFYDLSGPSLVVDTACSSSLVALHSAVRSLRSGECDAALVGGVNFICHSDLSIAYHKAGMLAPDGRCKVFDATADGYVRSEGAVVLMLKPLRAAIADGNRIHAVVRGSATNHGGLAGGLTVPNPQKQKELLVAAWKDAGIAAHDLTCLEAHGTGTSLGDPIEVEGMQAAYAEHGPQLAAPSCAIGSVKSNLGHLESAAGITGLLKVILSLRHRQLPASVNFTQLNPAISLDGTPFAIQDHLREWIAEPRVAGVSSFGSGGANAHVVVQEYSSDVSGSDPENDYLFVLSAANDERLRDSASRVVEWLEREAAAVNFADAIFTWQTGRTAMKQRLAIKAKDAFDLREKLQQWLAGHRDGAGIWSGHPGKVDSTLARMWQTRSGRQLAVQALLERDLDALGTLWTAGMEIDWRRYYESSERRPRPASVPAYPFAKDRHWIEPPASRQNVSRPALAVIHPLLHTNTSDLGRQSYSATFTGDEFFLADHQVRADGRTMQKVLPAVAYLEMTRAAIDRALPAWAESTVLELRNTVWVRPIVVTGATQVTIALSANDRDEIDYEIYTEDAEQRLLHCQGRAMLSDRPAPDAIDVEQLSYAAIDPDGVYAAWARMGLVYGPAFRTITAIHHEAGQSVVRLRLPQRVDETLPGYVLHPSVMDGAVQAAVGFLDGWTAHSSELRLPFALESLRIVAPCTRDMIVRVRYAAGTLVKLDLDLCDGQGNVCVEMYGLSLRAANREADAGRLLATPVWERRDAGLAGTVEYAQHHVLLCEFADVDIAQLASLLPHSELLPLPAAGNLAQRYTACAVACFERIRAILRGRPQGNVLFQIVGDRGELAGLSGMLKTAALENPRFVGQLILIAGDMTAGELATRLEAEKSHAPESPVRYADGVRQLLRWQELEAETDTSPAAFRDDGVYLITGGMGGLGLLFAEEILGQTAAARVVLTGRSPEARAVLDGRVSYRQADLENADQVHDLIVAVTAEFGQLTGILHCAGMIADSFILDKDSARFAEVLAPKVTGTCNLDQASRDVALDFFVLFSSVNGSLGNVGQADYAAANGFMDQFAAHRNRQVAAGQRHGRTRSIDWPLWQAGGMRMDPASQELLQRTTGMQPMQTATGMQAFRRSLALPYDQVLVMEGDLARMRRTLLDAPAASAQPPADRPVLVEPEPDALAEKAEEYLRRQFSGVLKLPAHNIDPQAPLKDYGIDSMLAMKLTSRLEETFGSLSKTLFFEYQTVRELTAYFIGQHASQLTTLFAAAEPRVEASTVAVQPLPPASAAPSPRRRFAGVQSAAPARTAALEPIAIIGLSGRYPEAVGIDAYAENLQNGRDSIIEVPPERWDWREYYSEDRTSTGRHYSKWGGFISGVDEFDPLFFNIAPKEAKYIDPQERLFLQHAWMAVEDAGYTRASMQVPHGHELPGQAGVYAGVMWSEYQLWGTAARAEDLRMGFAGNPASIANRVSYALDLHGPSMTLDTMCSSSLTAIHVACGDLRHGRTSLAIAGGVNVSVHPHKYLMLSAGQFISSDGHCQSFGEGGDGYIPGEGVGVVVLKRLSEAERDGDHIYGVIRGSALTHGGKTNGYTVPNPQAQASAISLALSESGVDARHVSYVEAHGTGTKLGDPIEIAALGKAFQAYTNDTGFCRIGSAKSNIGHCESAAGIAGLTKILLQMRHQQIFPSLHSAELNPHIDFARGPFIVNQELRTWEQPVIDGRTLPRIAGLSSFGAGGSNAHVIVEEYPMPVQPPAAFADAAILLSARTPEQLRQMAAGLLDFVRARLDTIDLGAAACTLQLGREPMEERLGFVVSSVEQLVRKLEAFVAGEYDIEDSWQGQAKRNKEALSLFSTDADLKHAIDLWIANGKLSRLVDLWVKGLDVDWSRLYGAARPRRISLPTYPFAKERYWIDLPAARPAAAEGMKDRRRHRKGRRARGNVAVPSLKQEPLDVVERADQPITAAPVRRELALHPAAQPLFLPMERQKPAAIALAPLHAVAPPVARALSAKPVFALASLAVPAGEGAHPAGSPVRFYDCGDGTFSLEIASSRTKDMIGPVLEALERARTEPALKVLLLGGIEYCFPHGGRSDYNEALERKLFHALVSFPNPIVAVLEGDVIGAGFLAAALCDFMVCDEDADYGYRDGDLHPTPAVAALFAERFGDAQARHFLYASVTSTGRQLRARGWTCPILPWPEVEAYAQRLASVLATKSPDALRLLKEHLTRRVAGLAGRLTTVAAAAPAMDDPSEDVAIVRYGSAGVKEPVAGLGGHKALVLIGDDADVPAHVVVALERFILDSEIPVVAALTGDAGGNAWLIAQFCDAAVYSRQGAYSSAGIVQSPALAATAAAVFAERFGSEAAGEILLTAADYSGAELQQRVGALSAAEQEDVLAEAMKVAASWAALPRTTVAAWKRHAATTLREKIADLPAAIGQSHDAPERLPAMPTLIALQSAVVTATAHPDGIVVVRLEDRDAKNMFSDAFVAGVTEAFAHIRRSSSCKVVVLTGYDSYFASGGTRETLLAIQEGTARFTDVKVFQAALDCELPVIAAMQGHGIGAGWSMGMFADLVLLSEESRYVSPYMDYGFTPGAGATCSLAGKLGHDLARESLLTAREYAGRELKERRPALRVLPRAEVVPAAMALARQIAQSPRHMLIGLKQQLTFDVRRQLEDVYRRELAMHEQTFVGRSDTLARIRERFHPEIDPPRAEPASPAVVHAKTASGDAGALRGVSASLRTLLAGELQVRESDVDDHAQFVDLGLDSISGVTWMRKINAQYQTSIEATKIYSYPTLIQLSRYVKEEAEKAGTLSSPAAPPAAEVAPASAPSMPPQRAGTTARTTKALAFRRRRAVPRLAVDAPATQRPEPVAIIGMAGQFPQARNLEEFWQNIAGGRNCITEVPRERWDVDAFYQPGDPLPGKTSSRWAGVLDDYDRFDPLFFNISPAEAESIDPQQRLFLQACWQAVEDAGYAARSLSGSRTGVFAGCANGDYHQLSREHQLSAQGFTGSAMSILAARIAYFLNLQGPCVSIDTACSSSLVAIAQACDSLTSGAADLALAGGVYVMAGPEMHIKTSQAGMLSPEGRCFTFDARANGFVPGEGVAVVLLKRLADAERDRDIIHAVIHGWRVNQDGKTNGITAPSPESQTRLEQEVYDRFGIDPAGIQLVEAHGTGTKLGDPIEVEGLKNAFAKYTRNRDYCALGSVKSNIGHCLAAAGVAGLLKVVLSLKHRQLPPTINFEALNEHIDLQDSPFYVNGTLREWEAGPSGERRAATSSFGFSGTNAHLVLGEHLPSVAVDRPIAAVTLDTKAIIPLSARTPEQLQQKARDLLDFIRRQPPVDLVELAYTLQAGREPMEERLGILAESVEQLAEKLEAWLHGQPRIAEVHRGRAKRAAESTSVIGQDDDVKELIVASFIANGKLTQLLELWVHGLDLDWTALYGGVRPRRIALPVYPFARERYWIAPVAVAPTVAQRLADGILHPLLHANTSDLGEHRYTSTFTGEEHFLTDHRIRTGSHIEQKLLPGVAYLEMARAAMQHAWPGQAETNIIELRDHVWLEQVAVTERRQLSIALLATEDDRVDYEIYSTDGAQETVHCQGQAVFSSRSAPGRIDLEQLRRQMGVDRWEAAEVYDVCARMGLHYGPAHRGITAMSVGEHALLAQLRLPAVAQAGAQDYVLHPSMMDSALQASIGLLVDRSDVPATPLVPFALDSLRILAPWTKDMIAWVRYADGSQRGDRAVKVDVDLCDEEGQIRVEIRGFALRALKSGTVEESPHFDDAFYGTLLDDIVNRRVSIDEALAVG
jgi:acyl transferase domain-containing protein/enoyl-CoA hydratase/carnithine racemase/acyl carrier protein